MSTQIPDKPNPDQSPKTQAYEILDEPVANPKYEGMTMRQVVLGLANQDQEKEESEPSESEG